MPISPKLIIFWEKSSKNIIMSAGLQLAEFFSAPKKIFSRLAADSAAYRSRYYYKVLYINFEIVLW